MSKKLTIQEMKELANKRGGECLSKVYVNARSKLKWKCKKGHIWEAVPHTKKNIWCPYCSKKKKLTIQKMRELAKERGGRCLSKIYINAYTNLKWECKKGHIWEASAGRIKHGTWCYKCRRNIPDIDDIKNLAEKKGGECLSKKYIDSRTHLKWKCKKGHTWKANLSNIKNGTWCPKCVHSKLRKNIKEIKSLAIKKNGKCLSKKYINDGSLLKWVCSKGHTWKATTGHIKRGQWCPYCNSRSANEELCRRYIESIFRKKFPKKKPLWLKNSRGNRMELDGYCESLQIAFEYHGEQHYRYVDFFHQGNKEKFNQRKKDDKRKEMLCKKNGVFLIVIPYTVPKKELKKFIKEKVKSFLNL